MNRRTSDGDTESAAQGSQASTSFATVQESVNPRTGALSVNIPLVSLEGVTPDIKLALFLSYVHGAGGVFKLPQNWVISIPYILGDSLVLNGACHIIDDTWTDDSGYASGLRYVNEHGMKFSKTASAKPLPVGYKGKYRAVLRTGHGKTLYFDAWGKLLLETDRWNNAIFYEYTAANVDVTRTGLKTVTDSYGQQTHFFYRSHDIKVTLPNGAQTVLSHSDRGIVSVKDDLGHVTSLSYGAITDIHVLTQINYPTGLTSHVSYTKLKYYDAKSQLRYLPAVEGHRQWCKVFKELVEDTTYDYGNRSFTGAALKCKLTPTQDGLMDSQNTGYRYDVIVTKHDADKRPIMRSRLRYNYLHLLLESTRYHLDKTAEGGEAQSGEKTVNEYHDSTKMHSRTTNYNKPIRVKTMSWSDADGCDVLLNTVSHSYNQYGLPLTQEIAEGNAATPHRRITFTYQPAAWLGELPCEKVEIDLLNGTEKHTRFFMSDDKAAIERTETYLCGFANETPVPWKTQFIERDSHGRVCTDRLVWSDAPSQSRGCVSEVTNSYAYSFDTQNNRLTVEHTDALGHRAKQVHDTSLPGAPTVKSIGPTGLETNCSLDNLGRETSATDAEGHVTEMVYKTFRNDGENSVTVTQPSGFAVKHVMDALSRARRSYDDGVEGASGSLSRLVQSVDFATHGKVACTKDWLGLETRFEYDSLRRLVSTIDPQGNITTTSYAPLAEWHYINGFKTRSLDKNGLGQIIRDTRHAWSEDGQSTDRMVHETSYDGFGRGITERTNQRGEDSALTPLTDTKFAYDFDNAICQVETIGHSESQVTRKTTSKHDLLGNTVSNKTATHYADGRYFEQASDSFVYNALGQLIEQKNAKGQVTRFAYDPEGDLVETTRCDGSKVLRTYTARGLLKNETTNDTSKAHGYDPDGQLKTITKDDTAEQRFVHKADGSLSEVHYPDGCKQVFEYDAAGRLVAITDPSGARTEYSFRDDGRLHTIQHAGDTLTYAYGPVNGRKSALVAYTISGNTQLSGKVGYDSFDRPCLLDVSSGAEKTIYKALQKFDALGRLTNLTETVSGTDIETRYSYDGLNQVQSETRDVNGARRLQTNYSYDGNGNVLQKAVQDGKQTKAYDFNYNALDQLTFPIVAYDEKGRMTQDDSGRTYLFNDIDQLLEVSDSTGSVTQYQYHPDGTLAQRKTAKGTQQFYYNSGQANCVKSDDAEWTSFLMAGTQRLASYTSSDDPIYFLNVYGSTRAQLRAGTALHFSYTAYGGSPTLDGDKPDDEATPETRFLWKQEYHDDASDITYLRSRFYHPDLMRFLSMDSLPLANRYGFALGDPVNLSDPSGHSAAGVGMDVFGTLLGVAAAIVFAPETGGASLTFAATALATASGAAAVVNDATPGGNRSAAEAAMVLGFASVLVDLGNAAMGAKAVAESEEEAALAQANYRDVPGNREAGRQPAIHSRKQGQYDKTYKIFVGENSRKTYNKVRVRIIGGTRKTRAAFVEKELNGFMESTTAKELSSILKKKITVIDLQNETSQFAFAYGKRIILSPNYHPMFNLRRIPAVAEASTQRILAHEFGHVAYPGESEQWIVDNVENPFAVEKGWSRRGRY